MRHRPQLIVTFAFTSVLILFCWLVPGGAFADSGTIGQEVGAPERLADGQEQTLPIPALVEHGEAIFSAVWTDQEGGGRPLTKGTGGPLAGLGDPLTFPRNFNRVSAPDSNSCAGCHTQPFGSAGGEGDIVANVFVLGQRFDFLTFDVNDPLPTGGSANELGEPVLLDTAANSRATTGMFGSGYIEMLARQITADLQATRDVLGPGQSAPLTSKGISFGTLSRLIDGSWDVSAVDGLTPMSLASSGPSQPPSLIIRPWHQASAVISLREFTNNAMNHHHGIQSSERFGDGQDPDGDGFVDELTRADMTAATIFQAAMAVPGRVIPRDHDIEDAIVLGQAKFQQAGCATCHIPALPLTNHGNLYTEPNPYNPSGNLQPGQAPDLTIDLNDRRLPNPRLRSWGHTGTTWVPAFTDLKLHDITSGPGDPNIEPLNMHFPGGSPGFFAGNSRFLSKRLWGAGNTAPYFHHGKFTTMRTAILAHAGEAEASRAAFEALSEGERDAVIEFLKSLQILPPGTRWRVVDERGHPRGLPH